MHAARHTLPGHVRQRIRRIIADLAVTPRPPESIALNAANIDLRAGVEMRRIRVERWRIIYAVCDDERWVWVLALRRRPPYDYTDLPELLERL